MSLVKSIRRFFTFFPILSLLIILTVNTFAQSRLNLIIESEPSGAQVFIDAVSKGTTPLLMPPLPAGEHQLVIYMEGYENYITTLTKASGTVRVELKKHRGSLHLTTSPGAVNVYLDSNFKGTTPLTIKMINVGKHKLRLEKKGFRPWERLVDIAYQETTKIEVELKKESVQTMEVSGSMLIIAEPSAARVYLDGDLMGEQTPISLPKITPGSHEVEIVLDGYQIYHATIEVSSGKSSMVSAKLVKDIYWPMFRHDSHHSGYINTDFGSNLELIWKFRTGAEINTGLAVVGESVYVASQDRFLYCLNINNGARKWKYEGGEYFASSPAVVDGVVFIGNDDDYVHAIDAKSGQVKWKYLTGGDVSSSPNVVDNVVYVGSFDRFLYALNAQNGSVIWKYAADREIWSSPTFFNKIVYFGAIDGNLYAIDATNGTLRWKYKTGGAIKSSPTVLGNTLYCGSDDGYLYAIDAHQGTVKWQFLTDGAVKSSPSIIGRNIVFGSDDNSVYCINTFTEKQVWKFETSSDVSSSPAITNEMVLIGSWDRKVYNLDLKSGMELWQYTTGGSVASSPAIIGGKAFIGSRDGHVYAFEEK